MAFCICTLACITTLSLMARAQIASIRASYLWLMAAAGVFGCGVWSLHFVAMLAFIPAVTAAYDVWMTMASVVLAIVGTLLAFLVWRLLRFNLLGGLLGGGILGISVISMHYIGIAAMRLPGTLSFDAAGVVASVIISTGFGVLALARCRILTSFWKRVEVSGWLALCICGAHFTGMSALTVTLGHPVSWEGTVVGSRSLGLAVGSVSLAILLVSLAATLMEQHLSQRTVIELKRIRLLSSLSHEVMMIYRDGLILEMNVAGGRLFGRSVDDLLGCDVADLFSAADMPAIARRERGRPEDQRSEEVMAITATGQLIPVELSCSIIDYEGRTATAMALRDLSDRKRDEEVIRHLAHHDALTGLPNRFLLKERVNHALDAAARDNAGVAVLYMDLDRFKPVNDLLGHASGDTLLIQVSKRLRAQLRPTDTLARVGGDEFVVVSSLGWQPEKVAILATRLIEALAQPFELDGRQIEIGVSIGIALFPSDGGSQDTLMSSADTALYQAKEEKRGTFRFYEAAMDEHLHERRLLEQDLRHAVDHGELKLYYQPLVNCRTNEVDGFEALLRWHHPQRGLILPTEFIPLAEETGQITKIGQWALETACKAAVSWPKPYWVAINVSPVQFRQNSLPRIVSSVLKQTGLAACRLEIEVTENVFIDDSKRAIDVLSALRQQGVCISLDDFGTGYSSLSYLTSFAFDKIKIDRSFVKGIAHNEQAAAIVHTIIGLGHNLGLSVTVEGIETAQQLAMVQEQGCDHVQGYLLGRPLQDDPLLVSSYVAKVLPPFLPHDDATSLSLLGAAPQIAAIVQ